MRREEWGPGELLELSGSYWKGCVLHAGVKLDVFTALGGEALTASEIAGRVAGDVRGVTMLLDALAALGLLVKSGKTYANTPTVSELLSPKSPRYLGHILLHHHHLMASWARLPEAVRTGNPIRGRGAQGPEDEEERAAFLMGMFNLAMAIAPRLAAQIDLSGRRRLLDLGGGPGTYAIHFCLRNPGLRATVFDLPTTRPFAEKTIAGFGVADRVAFASGNYLQDPLPATYDVAWLSHILHAEGPDECRRIIRKTVSALEPGGAILIHDFLLDDSGDRPLFPALFALNMLLGTPRGRSYTEGQIREMLSEAGAKNIERLPFQGPNDSRVLAGAI